MLTLHCGEDRSASRSGPCAPVPPITNIASPKSAWAWPGEWTSRTNRSRDRQPPSHEAQSFKTLKYHAGEPVLVLETVEDPLTPCAIAFCRSFFPWYNTEHRHAGIAMLTPDDVHHHRAPDVLAKRGRTLQAAWALHPERFVHGTPKSRPAFPSEQRLDQKAIRRPILVHRSRDRPAASVGDYSSAVLIRDKHCPDPISDRVASCGMAGTGCGAMVRS